jgi:ATP-binding cassette subfamily B protein
VTSGRRYWSPEVIQTSAMDCGPAALKCLLEGFGIPVSYGRLREACQTDVDGTSIDTLETVANQLGLDAEQSMMPADHLVALGNKVMPALAVVRLPSGVTHFAVLWRKHGPFVQVMDPATGRRYLTTAPLVDDLYVHTMSVPAEAWREWAAGDEFLAALVILAGKLGVPAHEVRELHARAVADPSWRSLAALDAAVRMTGALLRAGGVRAGGEARRVLSSMLAKPDDIPASYWPARPGPASDADELVEISGVVLVRVGGRKPVGERAPLSSELEAALAEPSARPGRDLLRFLRADGRLTPLALLAALAVASAGLLVEALLLFGCLEISRELGRGGQRVAAASAALTIVFVLLLLDLGIASGIARMGRRLEARLRIGFLAKIPRLPDRYFRSRLTSDMAERSHSVHALRQVSDLGARIIRSTFDLALTTLALVWLYPEGAVLAIAGALLVIAIPFGSRELLIERDLRVRTHAGALARFYLDALLGVVPIRTHGAEAAVRREHESLLVDWCRAGYRSIGAVAVIEGLQALVGVAMTTLLVAMYVANAHYGGGTVLLLAYWALSLPVVGQDLALATREAIVLRSRALRLAEPLGAAEDRQTAPEATKAPLATNEGGVSIEIDGVAVHAGGHVILEDVSLEVLPGQHVGIVGVSGAGKSTLLGLLLGFQLPASGEVRVDGAALEGERLAQLRATTAWVDPAVHIWNRTLLDNLYYGTSQHEARPLDRAVDVADLRGMLERLPDGLQSQLGEGGARVSGGEGQRLRLARGLLRADQRLVVLDEPFRGLDREARDRLLVRARAWWRSATLLCVTHDVSATRDFDRVVVIEAGRVIEQGDPRQLAAGDTRYAALLAAEHAVRTGAWSGAAWRRLAIARGQLTDQPAEPS